MDCFGQFSLFGVHPALTAKARAFLRKAPRYRVRYLSRTDVLKLSLLLVVPVLSHSEDLVPVFNRREIRKKGPFKYALNE